MTQTFQGHICSYYHENAENAHIKKMAIPSSLYEEKYRQIFMYEFFRIISYLKNAKHISI